MEMLETSKKEENRGLVGKQKYKRIVRMNKVRIGKGQRKEKKRKRNRGSHTNCIVRSSSRLRLETIKKLYIRVFMQHHMVE